MSTSVLRRKVGCLLLYGRTTPPPSITMLNGRVQVWIREDQDEAFCIFDVIWSALQRELVSGVRRDTNSERTGSRALLFEDALRAISMSGDSGHWLNVYRDRGGGYEGLQAIAKHALARDALLRDSGL